MSERFKEDNQRNAQRYWYLFVKRMDNMLHYNQTVHEKVEQAIRRHYTFTEKPMLPRVKWRQKQKRSLPFVAKNVPFNWGYFVQNNSRHYEINKYMSLLFFRKPNKIITQRYIEHICKELGYYLA